MNYDKIILELLSRVQDLEVDVDMLKSRLIESGEEPSEDGGGVTRAEARDIAIKEIEKRFPDYVVQKALRKDGSGILLHLPDCKQPYKIKFYHSKMHERGSGWHTVNLDDVMGLAYCMFSLVDNDGNWYFFIYGTDEIGEYRDKYRTDKNSDLLHLYFSVKAGKAIEDREGTIDVTDHLNNWKILSESQIKH